MPASSAPPPHALRQMMDDTDHRVIALKDRLSMVRALFWVFAAICVALVMVVGLMWQTQRADLLNDLGKKNLYEPHTIADFNGESLKVIDSLRKEQSLESLDRIQDDKDFKAVVAAWQGCALNSYADAKAWTPQSCAALVPYSAGFKTSVEVFEWNDRDPEGSAKADANAPTVEEFAYKIKDQMNAAASSMKDEVKVPAVMEAATKGVMVYIVGNGGAQWKVYVFTTQKMG